MLSKAEALPDLVILDLHFARPEERLLPEDKSHLPVEPKQRKAAVEDLRRKQGLHILSRAAPGLPEPARGHVDHHRRRAGRRPPG